MATRISVINSEYCLRKSIKLTIDTDEGVTYINDEVIFRVEGPSFTLHNGRVLCDVSGNPILTLYNELSTTHGQWQVFKHGSTDSDDLLFAVKRSSSRKPHKKNIDLDVFLAKNTEEHVWDFKVNAAGERSCDIRAHGSSTILAKMTNKGAFEVEVQPNVDYAFIVALLMIVDEINNFDNAGKVEGETLLHGMEIGATTLDVMATGAAYVNDIIGATKEGAAYVNDILGATEEGAAYVNDILGATEEGAAYVNDIIGSGATEEGDDDNTGATEEGDDEGATEEGDDAGATEEGADDNTGATEEGADDAGATEEGDDAGAMEEGDDDNTGATEEGDDEGATEEGDDAGATEEGDDAGAMEEGADDNTGATEEGDDEGATKEGADDAGATEEGDDAGATEEGADMIK